MTTPARMQSLLYSILEVLRDTPSYDWAEALDDARIIERIETELDGKPKPANPLLKKVGDLPLGTMFRQEHDAVDFGDDGVYLRIHGENQLAIFIGPDGLEYDTYFEEGDEALVIDDAEVRAKVAYWLGQAYGKLVTQSNAIHKLMTTVISAAAQGGDDADAR